jgi:hypothetical protein
MFGYYGFGQSGYLSNPYLYGSNPFGNYFSGYNNFSSPSLFPSYNFGGFPSYTGYNFLNNPMQLSSYNPSLSGASTFGTGLNTGLGSYGYGGYGNFSGYNFLNSGLTPPSLLGSSLRPPLFSGMTSPYSFTNWTNLGQTQSTDSEQTQASQSETPKEKVVSNGSGYGPEFLSKVKRIANEINCNYKDLLAVMNAESGIKSTAVNKSTNATGLIQFMPKTAQGLGTTVEKLKQMSPVEQLDYVARYLKQTKKQAGFSENKQLSGGELYALVFRPAKAKTGVFATKGEAAYRLNAGLDLNKDGRVTMAELGQRVKNFYVSDNSFLA